MSLLARVFLPALLLVLPLLSLTPPAAGQPYDTPQMAAPAGSKPRSGAAISSRASGPTRCSPDKR